MQITEHGLRLTRLYTGDDGESHLETVTPRLQFLIPFVDGFLRSESVEPIEPDGGPS